MVGDQLQRDDGQGRLQRLQGVGDVEDVLGEALDLPVALGGDGDDAAAAAKTSLTSFARNSSSQPPFRHPRHMPPTRGNTPLGPRITGR